MSKLRTINLNQIPDELLNDRELNEHIRQLPENYNFEIHKTIWRIRTIKAKRGLEYMSLSMNIHMKHTIDVYCL
jgi:hypothetical protein